MVEDERLQIAELDNTLPLSGLQHLAFCPRQWALIHLEQVWSDNRLTAEGRVLHERADLPSATRRGTLRTVRGMSLVHRRLQLTGRADVVEFHPTPFPVEYKRGKRKPNDCDLVQLCAQALCLEEMMGQPVPRGAIFYGDPRRRMEVEFTQSLRQRTEDLAHEMHRLYDSRTTPNAQPAAHCKNCSLVNVCLPEATETERVSTRWQAAQSRLLQADP